MRIAFLALAAVGTAGTAFGQTDDPNTFPLHLEEFEADSVDTTLLGQNGYIRWQQIDSDSATFFHIIKKLQFRRDYAAAAPLATAQTVDMELAVGFNQVSAFTDNFDNNWIYLGVFNSKTVVVPRTSISLPDWTQIPNIRPTPFDVTLDLGFFTHQAAASFLWELQVWSTAAPTHPLDATLVNGTFHSSLARTGAGCGPTAYAYFDVTNWNAQSALTLSVANAPPGEVVYALLGLANPNLPLGFLCAPLRVNLSLPTVPIGVANGGGAASLTLPLGAYNPANQFFTFYAQAITAPSLTLSDGVKVVMPMAPSSFVVKHVWSTNPTATTGTGPITGGVVALINDF